MKAEVPYSSVTPVLGALLFILLFACQEMRGAALDDHGVEQEHDDHGVEQEHDEGLVPLSL